MVAHLLARASPRVAEIVLLLHLYEEVEVNDCTFIANSRHCADMDPHLGLWQTLLPMCVWIIHSICSWATIQSRNSSKIPDMVMLVVSDGRPVQDTGVVPDDKVAWVLPVVHVLVLVLLHVVKQFTDERLSFFQRQFVDVMGVRVDEQNRPAGDIVVLDNSVLPHGVVLRLDALE